MATDPEFLECMNQTISVANEASRSGHGDPSYGAPAETVSKVEEFCEVVHDAAGEERATSHKIFTPDTGPIVITDAVWLPGDDDSDDGLLRNPIRAHPVLDDLGAVHHYETLI